MNYPGIMEAIYSIRDGREPRTYGQGKYDLEKEFFSPPTGGDPEGRGGQYANSGLDQQTAQDLTKALNRFADKKLVVYSEMIKKDIENLDKIQTER